MWLRTLVANSNGGNLHHIASYTIDSHALYFDIDFKSQIDF